MSKQWLVRIGDEEHGPISSAELRKWSQSGRISKSDFVKRPSMDKWVAANKVRGLAFKSNDERQKLADAYLSLAKKIAQELENKIKTLDDNTRLASILREQFFDEVLLQAIESKDTQSLTSYCLTALGHDIMYWSIAAILADGKVDTEELAVASTLLEEIAKVFSRKLKLYDSYGDLKESQREEFLAKFKKEKKHYSWPSSRNSSRVGKDVLVGSQVALVASLMSPLSQCLNGYYGLIESLVSAIIMIDGQTAVEKALLARAGELHEQFQHQLEELFQIRARKSTLLLRESESPTREPSVARSADFRKVSWGMSKDEVRRLETGELIHEDQGSLFFSASIANLNAWIIYVFAAGICVRAKYSIQEQHANQNLFLNDYRQLRELLYRKYGKPSEVAFDSTQKPTENFLDDMSWRNDLYRDDFEDWGLAVSIGQVTFSASWVSNRAEIDLILCGDNYDITLAIEYKSTEMGHLEGQIKEQQYLDDL